MKQPNLSMSPCCHEPALLGEVHQLWSDWIKNQERVVKDQAKQETSAKI